MLETQVVVVGAGIVGSFIFNTLTLNGIESVLIEKKEDVSLGATKANSGIIHAGYDCKPNTLKAKFNVEGNKMYNKIAKRLGEQINNCGSLVVGDRNSLPRLQELLERGKQNGVNGLKILTKKKLKKLEPNLSDEIEFGLFAKSAKIVSPYNFCISLCEEAILNGGKLFLNCNVKNIQTKNDGFVVETDKENFCCKILINACAEGVNEINKMLEEKNVPIKFTKGEYILLDYSEHGLVNGPIFPLPTDKGKGILACPTVHGNIFFGPTAVDVEHYDTTVNYTSLQNIKSNISGMIKNVNFKKAVKLYAGVRVKTEDDFYVKFSDKNPNYLVISGICSPGLSSAPAIAKWVLDSLIEKGFETKKIKLKKRKPYTNILKLSKTKLNRLIRKNKAYGNVVCRCETITEGEILEVLKGPIKVVTTDGIKRRLRASMGRCQGSFCYPKLLKIMANFYNTSEDEICMKGKESVVVSNIKEGGIYE